MESIGLGEVFALICAILWATAVILFKLVGESMSANQLNFAKNLIALGLLLPTAMLVDGFSLPGLSTTEWVILAASGYIGIAVADTWYLQALRYIGAGRTAIVGSLYSPFVVILSIVYLGEVLQVWQWLGFVMVLIGILIVVYQRHYRELEADTLYKGATFAAFSVFFTAAGVVAMKPILVHDGFFWLVALRMLAGVVGMIIFMIMRGTLVSSLQVLRHGSHAWGRIVIAAVFGTYLSLIFWLAGFKYTEASTASVLNETSNVFIVLLAAIFLGEGLARRRLIGIVLTFLGVIVFLGLW